MDGDEIEMSKSSSNLLSEDQPPKKSGQGTWSRIADEEYVRQTRAHAALTGFWVGLARGIIRFLPGIQLAACCLTTATVCLAVAVIVLFATTDAYRVDGGTVLIPRANGLSVNCSFEATAYIFEGDGTAALNSRVVADFTPSGGNHSTGNGTAPSRVCDPMRVPSGAACPDRISGATITSLCVALGVLLPWLCILRCALMAKGAKEEIGKAGHAVSLLFIKLYESVYRNSFMITEAKYASHLASTCTRAGAHDDGRYFILGAIFPPSLDSSLPAISTCTLIYGAILIGLLRPARGVDGTDMIEFRFKFLRDCVTGSQSRRRMWHAFVVALTGLVMYATLWFCLAIYFANVAPYFEEEVGRALGALVQFSVADLVVLLRANPRLHEPWYSPFLMLRWISNLSFVIDALLFVLVAARSKIRQAEAEEALERAREEAGADEDCERDAEGETLKENSEPMRERARRFCFGSCSLDTFVHVCQLPHLMFKGPLYLIERFLYRICVSFVEHLHTAFRVGSCCLSGFIVCTSVVCMIGVLAVTGSSQRLVLLDDAYVVFPVRPPLIAGDRELGLCAHFAVSKLGPSFVDLPPLQCSQPPSPSNSSTSQSVSGPHVVPTYAVRSTSNSTGNGTMPCELYESPSVRESAETPTKSTSALCVTVFTILALAYLRLELFKRDQSRGSDLSDESTQAIWKFAGFTCMVAFATAALMSTLRNGWALDVDSTLPNGHRITCLAYVLPIWTTGGGMTALEFSFALFAILYVFILPVVFVQNERKGEELNFRCCKAERRTVASTAAWISITAAVLLLVTLVTVPLLRTATPLLFRSMSSSSRFSQLWMLDVGPFAGVPEQFSYFTMLRYCAMMVFFADVGFTGLGLLERAMRTADSFDDESSSMMEGLSGRLLDSESFE